MIKFGGLIYVIIGLFMWVILFPLSVNLLSQMLSENPVGVCSMGICIDNTYMRLFLTFIWIFVPFIALIYIYRRSEW